jgi:hypothetical protein
LFTPSGYETLHLPFGLGGGTKFGFIFLFANPLHFLFPILHKLHSKYITCYGASTKPSQAVFFFLNSGYLITACSRWEAGLSSLGVERRRYLEQLVSITCRMLYVCLSVWLVKYKKTFPKIYFSLLCRLELIL